MKKYPKKKVLYEQSIVAYVDILGFRELVETESAGKISKTLRLVKEAVKPGGKTARLYQLYYQSFSDLNVVATPLFTPANLQFSPGLLHYQFLVLAKAQATLIAERILVRGAIVVGSIVKSYQQLFGPAMIKAYDIERKTARFPRIVVDQSVIREMQRNPLLLNRDQSLSGINRLLRKDNDGLIFLDYIRAYQEITYSDSRFKQFLKSHKELITEQLNNPKNSPKKLRKYKWLAKYHDLTIDQLIQQFPARRSFKRLRVI